MSASTARQHTRRDALVTSARRAHPAVIYLTKQTTKAARVQPGGTKAAYQAGGTPDQGCGHVATTPASHRAGRRHGLHVFLRIL
jgi:hypothetical protein